MPTVRGDGGTRVLVYCPADGAAPVRVEDSAENKIIGLQGAIRIQPELHCIAYGACVLR